MIPEIKYNPVLGMWQVFVDENHCHILGTFGTLEAASEYLDRLIDSRWE